MPNLTSHAERELALIGGADDEMQKEMNSHILKMVKIFAEEGHSGFSASYAVSLLEKLLRFEPLTPLTGSNYEWVEVGEGLYQNNRCSHIFKENGNAYDIQGIVWRDKEGHCYTNFASRVAVEFPYTPKIEYRDEP